MGKIKTCEFCGEDTDRLFYSNPKCCGKWQCKSQYNEQKEKKKSGSSSGKGNVGSGNVGRQAGRKTIAPFSKKKLEELKEYRKLRDEFLKDKPLCEINSPKCTGMTTELHHAKPRAYHLCDVSVFVASCRACNSYVESHHEWARKRGFKQDHL